MTSGVGQIVRFNWPFYAAAGATTVIALSIVSRLPGADAVHALIYLSLGCAVIWMAASLTASWIVYDVSPLMRWDWIPAALGVTPRTWLNIHAGLDQSTPALRRMFGDANGRVFDMFDPVQMTEPSIVRARRLARNAVEAEHVDFRHLPIETGSVDALFLLLSAHELRDEHARDAFFAEAHRVLARRGRVLVAEHLRDLPNLGAFGPGFLHFHSRRTWTRAFRKAGFAIHREFSMTPFVRIFVLRSDV